MDSDSDHEKDFNGWEDESDENTEVKSLFSAARLPNVAALIQHDQESFGFDLTKCCEAVGLEDTNLIMLVNFIRTRVQDQGGETPTTAFASALQAEICEAPGTILANEQYMRPVLQDEEGSSDALLYLLSEALCIDLDDVDAPEAAAAAQAAAASASGSVQEGQKITQMQAEIEKYKALLAAVVGADNSVPGAPAAAAPAAAGAGEGVDGAEPQDDAYYFDSYGQLSIHETMLRDKPRTTTYGAAMLENPDFFKGKTVLDVGCGTGILCMFAAKAGAKKVVGVDLSSIIERSKKVVEQNGFADTITLVRGRLEEVDLPLVAGEVDVIVSEWMGYGLYFENMLTSVLHARDKYLNPTAGVVMPSEASLYIEALSAQGEDDRVGYWSNVYGFDMLVMRDMLTKEAQVQYVWDSAMISQRQQIHNLDCNIAVDEDLDFETEFELVITDDSTLQGFVVSFDVLFGQGKLTATAGDPDASFKEKVLGTGPAAPATHWKQTVMWFDMEKRFEVTKGDIVKGRLSYLRAEGNKRDYDLYLRWTNPKTGLEGVQTYVLAS